MGLTLASRRVFTEHGQQSLRGAELAFAPLVRISLLVQRWPYIASFSSMSLRSVAPASDTPPNSPCERDHERISAVHQSVGLRRRIAAHRSGGCGSFRTRG